VASVLAAILTSYVPLGEAIIVEVAEIFTVEVVGIEETTTVPVLADKTAIVEVVVTA